MGEEPGEGIEPQGPAPSWTETGVRSVPALIPYVGGAIETVAADVVARRRDRAREMAEPAVREAGGADALLDAVGRNERVAGDLATFIEHERIAWRRAPPGPDKPDERGSLRSNVSAQL